MTHMVHGFMKDSNNQNAGMSGSIKYHMGRDIIGIEARADMAVVTPEFVIICREPQKLYGSG